MNTNKEILARMEEDILLRGLAQGTREDYIMHAGLFLRYAQRPVEELDEQDIRQKGRRGITDIPKTKQAVLIRPVGFPVSS